MGVIILSDSGSQQAKSCFIIGPIGTEGSAARRLADWLLHGIFRPVLEGPEFGYTVKRADDDAEPGSIANAIIMDIIGADLVVADLTGFNPNVFYELGIRHAIQLPTIHVIAERVDLPFDNKDQRTIFIDIGDITSVNSGKERLRKAVLALSEANYKISNPFTQARALNALQDSADPRDQVIANLERRLDKIEKEKVFHGSVDQGELTSLRVADKISRLSVYEKGKLIKAQLNPAQHQGPDNNNIKGLVEIYLRKDKDTGIDA